jgi:hypothetical protein
LNQPFFECPYCGDHVEILVCPQCDEPLDQEFLDHGELRMTIADAHIRISDLQKQIDELNVKHSGLREVVREFAITGHYPR